MPRVTKRDQYKRYLELRQIWLESSGGSFGILTPGDQWKVHAFYRPSEHLLFEEFSAHLRQIREKWPRLVHVVGKLSRQVLAEAEQYAMVRRDAVSVAKPTGAKTRKQRVQGVTVTAIVRPRPDLNKLLKAMIQMAREESAKDNNSKTSLKNGSAETVERCRNCSRPAWRCRG